MCSLIQMYCGLLFIYILYTKITCSAHNSLDFCWFKTAVMENTCEYLKIYSKKNNNFLGIHNGCVFSANMDWWPAEIWGPHWDPASQQPNGQQYLDTGHFLPKWQTFYFAQHDHSQQAVPHHAERNYSVHHEVTCVPEHLLSKSKMDCTLAL